MTRRDLVERLKRVEHPLARALLLRARAAPHWALRGHARRREIVSGYLASQRPAMLHIGAGPHSLEGWLNSDLIAGDIHLDLARPLPLPDGAFDYVFGEHVIEHLAPDTAFALLVELRRIMRPGGVLRLTTPDLAALVALYEDRNPNASRDQYAAFLSEITGKPHDQPAQILNDAMRLWGHQHIYDEAELAGCLLRAGFARPRRLAPGESSHPPLRGLERHGGAEWVNRAEAMCLEADRPPEA